MTNIPLSIADIEQTDNETTYNIGDLRRAYGVPFGSVRLSKLAISTDPMFRILVAKRRVPVNESIFKIFEERPRLHKRYAYVVGYKAWTGSGTVPTTGYTVNSADISSLTPQTAGSFMALKMGTDFKSSGNIQNIFGQSTNAIAVGDSGTCPNFFLQDQTIRVSTKSAADGKVADDYFYAKIKSVQTSGNYAYIGVEVIRPIKTASNKYLCSFTDATTPVSNTYGYAPGIDQADNLGSSTFVLEPMRTRVVGSAYGKGTGIPGYWNDQPISSRYGLTTITKHAIGMDNTTRATETRFYKNEFDRLWDNVLLDHKWDLSHAMYMSAPRTDDDGAQHTQGMIDWAINHGNVFTLDTNKTVDKFLEDISTFTDPRYNPQHQMIYVVNTMYWNWLHKLGGYSKNNLQLGDRAGSNEYAPHYQFDFARKGTIGGADVTQFASIAGDMTVVKDIHLDAIGVKMLGVPLKYVAYRPLIGNGLNRDTTVYPEVQSVASNGVDATVHLVQTEWALECTMPEAWAVWS